MGSERGTAAVTRRIRSALLAAPAALLLAGCAGKGDLRQMEQTLLAEIQEVQARQDSLRRELASLRQQLAQGLEEREGEAYAGRGELLRRLERLEQEIGRIGALTGQNQQLLTRLEEASRSRPPASTRDAGGAATGDTTEGSEAGTAPSDGDPQALYQTALEQFRRGSYTTARSGLEQFLSRHPEHPLAPDARFYVAETYAESGEQRQALDAYGRVVELYPDSPRAASALYKSGLLELERGNPGDARVFLRRVVDGYPDSDEAVLARDQLDRLQGGG